MRGNHIQAAVLVAGLLFIALSVAEAGEIPPQGSRPLSQILRSVERQNLGVVTEAEFDDGLWEVKVCDSRGCQRLYIDPRSGRVTRRRRTNLDEMPPPDARPLSAIIQSVEVRRLGVITEVEFDDGLWRVEIRRDGRKIRLGIDPRTAEIRR